MLLVFIVVVIPGHNLGNSQVSVNRTIGPTLVFYLSCIMRKPAFGICKNKGTDQLCGNRTADQCLCFHYIDTVIPLLLKFIISDAYFYFLSVTHFSFF